MVANNAGERALITWAQDIVCELAFLEGLALGMASRFEDKELVEMLRERLE
jgi:hypothetical protein